MTVAVAAPTAFIRIPGRANFTSSVDFKTLVNELRQRGYDHFVLDLSECVTMDSTFLGVLAGIALRNADGKEIGKDGQKLALDLVNPNERIADLLDNLGVMHLFNVRQQGRPCDGQFEPVELDHPVPTKNDLSRNCLEAHETLMQVNPENIAKFKEVTRFLAEDLKEPKEGHR
jgi:anti-anti-sigma regulatory factor